MLFYRLMFPSTLFCVFASRTLAQASVEVTGAPQGCHEGLVRTSRGRYGMLARALWHAGEGVMVCGKHILVLLFYTSCFYTLPPSQGCLHLRVA